MARKPTLTLTRLNFDQNEFLDFQYIRALAYEAYEGASVGEVASVVSDIKRHGTTRNAFVEAWSRQGRHVEALGTEALSRGAGVTARMYFFRAYNYLRVAEFYFDRGQSDKHRKQYREGVACFDRAIRLLDTPSENIEIPYQNGVCMPGYFFQQRQGTSPRPTVIISGGGDGHGEEIYFLAGVPEALRRGFNVLLFHGPGQRGLLHRHPELVFRRDAEAPIGAVIDYALSRPEVDENRLALYGLSFGGYLAPRAAAMDRRIKALIANGPIYDFHQFLLSGVSEVGPAFFHSIARFLSNAMNGRDWNILIRLLRASSWVWEATIDNQMLWTSGVSTFGDFLEWARAYNLRGLEKSIICPTLCITSEGEGPAVNGQVQKFFDALETNKRIVFLSSSDGADGHCGVSNISHTAAIVYDWLLDVFAS